MPTRREAIAAAVAAHNRAHKPLPPAAVRLLQAMFPDSDTCLQSREALEGVTGLSRKSVQTALRALIAAGIVAKMETRTGQTSRYRLLLTLGDVA